jgi:hypothetical protein
MKHISCLSLIAGLALFGCNSDTKSTKLAKTDSVIKLKTIIKPNSEETKLSHDSKDKEEIQVLIRQVLKWADSKNEFDLVPALSEDSICVGIDFDKLNKNIEKLRKTGFFADEFIDNYNRILKTLDKKIKNKEFEKWNIYELPTFSFANDVSPWCSCQDNFSWDNVQVEIVNLNADKGELKWNWKLDSDTDQSWKDFAYKFSVVNVNNKWQISYLQGFDYEESIRRDGL